MPSSFLMIRRPRISPLFPYTTLFRSIQSYSARDRNSGVLTVFDTEPASTVFVDRSEEHTSELQPHRYISHAVFFFNDTATTYISTLSLHDALPIYSILQRARPQLRSLDGF